MIRSLTDPRVSKRRFESVPPPVHKIGVTDHTALHIEGKMLSQSQTPVLVQLYGLLLHLDISLQIPSVVLQVYSSGLCLFYFLLNQLDGL